MKYISLIIVCLLQLTVVAQVPSPGKQQTKKILIFGATAHLGNGKVIENSAIGFEEGKLTLVADASTIRIDKTYYDEIIQGAGKHVYPGFIAPNSTLGLTEIDAVRATRDFRDVGKYKPHVRSIIAYNTESRVSGTVRSNGVLIAQATPRGGRISGTSSIVQLDAWNWEDAVIRLDDGVHLNWPGMFSGSGWWAEPGPTKKNEKYNAEIDELEQFFIEAQAYKRSGEPVEKNIRFESMEGLWSGDKTLFVHANYVKDIENAIHFTTKMGVKKIVLVGGYDAWMVAELLKENNIAVMVQRVHSLPDNPQDDVNQPYKLPAQLQKLGVEFCLENSGDMEAMNARNLPFLAGTACAFGLTKEQAVASVTGNTAKILGIDKHYGTLEQEKSATLFISTGDALDPITHNVERAFIDGREVDLNDHQKVLYNKYKAKYESEEGEKE